MNAVRTKLAPYLLLSPFLVVFVVFMAYPLIRSGFLSTERSFGPGFSESVGFENYTLLFKDPLFWKAARNTAIFTAGSVFLQLPLSLGLAMVLNREGLRGRSLYRLIFFSPQLVGLVFSGMLASIVFEKQTGLVNRLLHNTFGATTKLPWMDDPIVWLDLPWMQHGIMWMLVITAIWMYVGFNMVYFLAALQNVNKSVVEAARIDGASPFQQFIHVTLPAIRPVATFVVLLSIIGSVQLFELPFVIFGQTPFGGGGPDNRALTLVMYLYQQAFQVGDLGYASAIGWIIAIVLCLAGLAQMVVNRRDTA